MMTGSTAFEDAAKYWLKVVIIHGRNSTAPTGYLFNVNGEKWLPTIDIFEGVSGVVLTLLSFKNPNCIDWDESLMLS